MSCIFHYKKKIQEEGQQKLWTLPECFLLKIILFHEILRKLQSALAFPTEDVAIEIKDSGPVLTTVYLAAV